MKKINLIFGTTNSQPVGAADDEIEHIYQRSYKPFLRALYNASTVPITLHYSGRMLEWLEKHHSEYIDVLAEMVSRKQVELLGGGFYDPVLSLIPRQDRIGQIESLTTLIRKRFGRRPRGSWLTQHVWEPTLASVLANSGMEYTFLDDYHFITGGFSGADLNRPCITEDQGRTIVVFPVSYGLSQTARSEPPEALVEQLRELSTEDASQVFTLIDDGERYCESTIRNNGPTPHNEWLERFLELLAENQEWVNLVLPSRVIKTARPRARGYFPSASYEEMMCWSRSPERKKAYERLRARFSKGQDGHIFGGYFRQFLTRYAESNLMYAKMQYTHVLVSQIRGDKYRKLAAREELWRGQCHSAYWHGRHGGIYANRLRKHVYKSLIEAEKRTREKGIFIPSIVSVDFDMDGLSEFLYQGQEINAYVHQEGGILFELDYLPVAWNYLDTLSRRREAYHDSDAEQNGYDRHLRRSFMDHVLSPDETVGAFESGTHTELGGFLTAMYEHGSQKRDSHRLDLSAAATVRQPDGIVPLRLHKAYTFKRSAVHVHYQIANEGQTTLRAVFAPEINVALLSDDPESARVFVRSKKTNLEEVDPGTGVHDDAREVQINDLVNGVCVAISSGEPLQYWIAPVRTVSLCGGELVRSYQSTAIVPRVPLELAPGQTIRCEFSLRLERL